MRGLGRNKVLGLAILMKCLSITSVTVKSAITPSFMGRTASMPDGTRPIMALASLPTAKTDVLPLKRPSLFTTTTEGSSMTSPLSLL